MLSPPNSMSLIAMSSLVPLRVGAPVFLNWPSERKYFSFTAFLALVLQAPPPSSPLWREATSAGFRVMLGSLSSIRLASFMASSTSSLESCRPWASSVSSSSPDSPDS